MIRGITKLVNNYLNRCKAPELDISKAQLCHSYVKSHSRNKNILWTHCMGLSGKNSRRGTSNWRHLKSPQCHQSLVIPAVLSCLYCITAVNLLIVPYIASYYTGDSCAVNKFEKIKLCDYRCA